jgi:tRNA G18 (ribose-2'-O)-methylase SpoU
MAATLRVPFVRADHWPDDLELIRRAGFVVAALTPRAPSETLGMFVERTTAPIAWLVGAEGDGLSEKALAHVDCRVRIPVSAAVDSLNLAVATGIALSRSREKRGARV